jgi:hypothetical protein
MLTPLSSRWFFFCLLSLCGLFLLTSSGLAAELETTALTLQANSFLELVNNRSRMIQFSLVCVVFGCALLWWRR